MFILLKFLTFAKNFNNSYSMFTDGSGHWTWLVINNLFRHFKMGSAKGTRNVFNIRVCISREIKKNFRFLVYI